VVSWRSLGSFGTAAKDCTRVWDREVTQVRVRLAVGVFLCVMLAVTELPGAYAATAGWRSRVEAAFSEPLHAARTGNVDLIRAAASRYVQELRTAVEAFRQALASPGESPPPGLIVAARTVEEVTRRHLTVLEGLLGRVPERAQPAIQHALEVAKTGHDQATAALDPATEDPARGRRPENTGPPAGAHGGPPDGAPGGPPGGGRGRP